MKEGRSRESILVTDCGNATTRVMFLDIVGGSYRFVARGEATSTGEPPVLDVTVGLLNAIAEIESITDRQFVDEKGQLLIPSQGEVRGVDLFVATTSAAPPLRVVLVGLMDDISLDSARRVALSTYATIVDTISLADGHSEDELIQQIIALKPDVFLITGGTDGGATERVLQLVEMVSVAITLLDNKLRPPVVIFAGNSEIRAQVAEILDGAQLRAAENVRPQLDVEYLDSAQAELNAIYEQHRLFELSGADDLNSLGDGGLVPTARAFGWTIQYLGEVLGNNVIGVDVGSATVTLGAAVNNHPLLAVRSDLGIGHNLAQLLDEVPPQRVLRWLTEEMSADDLRDFVANKTLFPRTIPVTAVELELELALVRELIRRMLPVAFPVRFGPTGLGLLPMMDMVLGSGAALASVPRPGLAVLAMLDALQPIGICALALDTQGLTPLLGAIAGVQPIAAVQVIESGAFRELGGVVAPVGHANPGDVVLSLKMAYANGGELEVEVEHGSLEVLPLPASQKAELTLRPAKGIDVGAGPGKSFQRQIYGGAVGLIVDARGRPLRLPDDPDERRAKLQQWLWDMGG